MPSKTILRILSQIAGITIMCERSQSRAVRSTSQNKVTRKSKLKQTKSKPNNKYKTSKPITSKVSTVYRNKSNLR